MAVIEARARRLGVWPADLVRGPGETDEQFAARDLGRQQMIRAAIAYVTQPWMGCIAGRAIAASPDVVALWQVVTLIRAARAAYLRAIDSPPDSAKGLRLAVATEPMHELHIEGKLDLRSDEEKAEAAIAAWVRLRHIIHTLGPGAEEGILSTVCRDEAIPGFPLLWALGRVRKALEKRT